MTTGAEEANMRIRHNDLLKAMREIQRLLEMIYNEVRRELKAPIAVSSVRGARRDDG